MKERKLKICVLGSTYPRFEEDPQVPWLRQTVKMLSEKGHDVKVAASAFAGGGNHQIDGIDVLRFRYAPKAIEKLTHDEGAPSKVNGLFGKILAITYIISGILHMLYWCKKHRFDVVNVHWPFPHGLFTILPRLFFGTKVVVTAHGAGMAMARKSPLLKLALKISMLSADAVTTNSSHTYAELKRLSGHESEVVPYGATVDFKESSQPFQGKEKVKILFSGRHIQRKGVDYLIRALPEVLAQRDVELVITGAGDRTDEWKRVANSLGLLGNVNFLGFVSNEELADCYQTCDIYCLPAIFDDNDDTEGLGVVLIEALLHARPVVACGVGGIVDVIKHRKTGLLVNEKSPGELAKALLWMINNPLEAKKMGVEGQKLVSEVFDWNKIVGKVETMLEDVVHTNELTTPVVTPSAVEAVV